MFKIDQKKIHVDAILFRMVDLPANNNLKLNKFAILKLIMTLRNFWKLL